MTTGFDTIITRRAAAAVTAATGRPLRQWPPIPRAPGSTVSPRALNCAQNVTPARPQGD